MKRAASIVLVLLLSLACDGDKASPVTPAPTVVTPRAVGVSISPAIDSVPPGQSVQLILTASYSDGSTKDVTVQAAWTSSRSQVATVSSGIVTGVTPGRVYINVRFEQLFAYREIIVKPGGTFLLRGTVTETGGVPVNGAVVEVIDGPGNQAITNSSGFYELIGVAGTVILRYGKAGYFDERRSVTMSGDQTLNVEITPRSAPANLAGTYRVTLTASSACTILPAEQRTRTYTAQITQFAARLFVTLTGASLVPGKDRFQGSVFGDSVTFDLGYFYYYYYYSSPPVQESLPDGQILGIFGSMTTTATPQLISGTLVGGFTLKASNNRVTTCTTKDSQLTFARQ
jgi:hypothetical protein